MPSRLNQDLSCPSRKPLPIILSVCTCETGALPPSLIRVACVRRQRTLKADEKFVKDAYVDLGVRSGDVLRELYEVKSSCERQSLYTAIGQVVVHDDSPSGICKRFLVLPDDEKIPGDVTRALTRSGISLVRFALQGDRVRVLKPA